MKFSNFNIIALTAFAGRIFAESINECKYINSFIGKEESFDCCSNDNIVCKDNHITEIWLSDYELEGVIPLEIGNLENLKILDLQSNNLSGTIPSTIGNLKNLRKLWLNNNKLEGEIPSTLGDLTKLQQLNLNDNYLVGKIPESLGNLSSLFNLYLNNNQLEGDIPSSFENLISIVYFGLNNNKLTGRIPSVEKLVKLRELHLENNDFEGKIPSFEYSKYIRTLNLENNEKLRGKLNVNSLQLSQCDLTNTRICYDTEVERVSNCTYPTNTTCVEDPNPHGDGESFIERHVPSFLIAATGAVVVLGIMIAL